MSRIANSPVRLPKGVQADISADRLTVKGTNGELSVPIHPSVNVDLEAEVLHFSPRTANDEEATPLVGTMRALANNLVVGVSEGFSRRLQLVGVGYRAQVQGTTLTLSLGYSHPVEFKIPEGISIEAPSQTEIVVKGRDKQQVGQVAAKIRGLRPPEPYKGKGVKYADETILRKEAKKK